MKKIFLLIFILLSISSAQIICQQLKLTEGEVVDKIVAIVGKEIILHSDIDAHILDLLNRGESADLKDTNIRNQLLAELVNEKLLITKAEEDSIQVTDEMVEERFNLALQNLISYYGSIERIESIYKKSLSRLKLEYKDDIKKRLMANQLELKKFSNVSVTHNEVVQFFDRFIDSLPIIPEQIELYHIFKKFEPDTNVKQKTFELAKAVRDSIIAGANFGEMAKKYSEDPGSKELNGELG
jgi:peptidyl-prolyl cis-trans isomerase SurA